MLNAYSVDTFTLWKWNGTGAWREPVAPTELTVRGYVEYKTKLVRNIVGEQVASTVQIYIHKANIDAALGRALNHEDRITISGDSFDRPIISIGQPKDFSHPHYMVALT